VQEAKSSVDGLKRVPRTMLGTGGEGCMERGKLEPISFCDPPCESGSKLNTFQIVHTVFGSLVISTATQTLPANESTMVPIARAGAGI
jgi:hypothetical protein